MTAAPAAGREESGRTSIILPWTAVGRSDIALCEGGLILIDEISVSPEPGHPEFLVACIGGREILADGAPGRAVHLDPPATDLTAVLRTAEKPHPGNDAGTPRHRDDREDAALLRKAAACAVRMSPDHEHSFEHDHDGDGWNEPLSDRYACICGHVVAQWTQPDPQNTGRPDPADMLLTWYAHVLRETEGNGAAPATGLEQA